MCMMSVVMKYGGTVPTQSWTRQTFTEFQTLAQRVAELDQKLGEPDCVDPEKEAWMRGVEARLKALEDGAA